MPEESALCRCPNPPAPAPVATIAEIGRHEGQSVTLRGWLYNLRESGKLLFPIFRDGTGSIQGVAHVKSVTPEVFAALKGLTQESSVIVRGKVRADKRAPGGYELDVEDVEVVQRVPESDPYPITLKEHGVDFLQEKRHLWVRSPRQSAILRIRAEIMRAAAEYFDSNGFVRTDPPILTPAACEGTSTLFPVDYFGDPAYLTQSGQLYVEATALALGKVYSFGPTFRAEKSKTRRHLTEFWMVEPEVAYMDLDGLMELSENFISHIVQSVLKNRAAELQVIGRDTAKLATVKPPFPRLRYDEAAKMLNQAHKDGHLEAPFEYGNDFGSPDETWLSSQYDRPVMVHRYPAECEGLLHGARPQRPALRALRRRAGAGGLRRNHRRLAARVELRAAQRAHREAQAAARGLRVVSRSAALRQRAARRLRHGHRARGVVGLRPGPRARNDSVRKDAAPHVSVRQATRDQEDKDPSFVPQSGDRRSLCEVGAPIKLRAL